MGTAYNQSVGGSVTPAGSLGVSLSHTPINYNNSVSGSLTPSGSLLVEYSHTPVNTNINASGSITPSGSFSLGMTHNLAPSGSITPSGALGLVKAKANQEFAGALTPSGELLIERAFSFSGSITPTATLGIGRIFEGEITPTGDLQVLTGFGGEIVPEGTLSLEYPFKGTVIPTGTLTVTLHAHKSFSGSIRPRGILFRGIDPQTPAGSITPTGRLRIQVRKSWSLAAMYDIIIEQGAGLTRYFRYYDSTGAAVDISAYEIRMAIKTSYDGTVIASSYGEGVAITITPTGGVTGEFSIDIDPEDTASMNFVVGTYDIEIDTGVDVIRILQGNVKLLKEVTDGS